MGFNPLDYPLAWSTPPHHLSDTSDWCGHAPLAMALVQMLRPGTIVEIGAPRVDSYLTFCQAVATLGLPTRCTAIDMTGGSGEVPAAAAAAAQLRAAHDPLYLRFSRLLRCAPEQAPGLLPAHGVDLLHVHVHVPNLAPQALRRIFELWSTKLSPAAVVLVYGLTTNRELRAEWDELVSARPNLVFDHASGLGVVAIGNSIAEPLRQMLQSDDRQRETIRSYFVGLGRGVELERQRRLLGVTLARQQSALSGWKVRIGLAVDPGSAADPAAEPLPTTQRIFEQIDVALVEDLRLRDQLRQLQSSQIQQDPAASKLTKDRRVSIIICSIDSARFTAVSAMYERLLADVSHEIIRIPDARSMSEGYNRGIDRSSGDVLVFSHDDLEFITADFAPRLLRHLERFDLVGLAGTTMFTGATWVASGPPYLFGQVSHPYTEGPGYTVSIFGVPKRVITGIQAFDGLFFAVNRRVVERVRFDEQFEGFHYYDLDFSLSCYQAGFQLAVVSDIHAIHLSSGQFGAEWQRLAPRFLAKWQPRLLPRPERPLSFCGVTVRTKEELLEVINPSYLD
jgi:hypothetical protein